ncbi:hypothetical protein QBC46DRAFT_387058 [Diplogelasinospora grovesii]|uniref:Secreted protein n=1 Tax=Diplogelasinospora grovesii TaxID=303347 RepID=A0AAN6N7G5_9PEZI|nr:hypothetical protein QBC46DRAFT_387058 [Diplogelasinospora grovesii]
MTGRLLSIVLPRNPLSSCLFFCYFWAISVASPESRQFLYACMYVHTYIPGAAEGSKIRTDKSRQLRIYIDEISPGS